MGGREANSCSGRRDSQAQRPLIEYGRCWRSIGMSPKTERFRWCEVLGVTEGRITLKKL